HAVLEYRDAVIRAQTFGREWLAGHVHPRTGRIHAHYIQLGTPAGRMACIRPNVQNVPRSVAYRSCIRADDGQVLVKADFSQIELRIAAVMANDEAMLSAFHRRQDLHAVTAARVLNLPLEQVGEAQRQLADALHLASVQGSGADGLRLALARLFAHRHDVPWTRLVACIHDEILAECPVEEVEQTAHWLAQHMTAAMTELVGTAVPIVVEVAHGRDWA